jgi:hypothetical protein
MKIPKFDYKHNASEFDFKHMPSFSHTYNYIFNAAVILPDDNIPTSTYKKILKILIYMKIPKFDYEHNASEFDFKHMPSFSHTYSYTFNAAVILSDDNIPTSTYK